jgi:allantoicase
LARFRVFGTPLPPLPAQTNLLKGAKVAWASDASYGTPESALREEREGMEQEHSILTKVKYILLDFRINLNLTGKVMAGWESKRHSARHALIVALSGPAKATKILVDTCILYY